MQHLAVFRPQADVLDGKTAPDVTHVDDFDEDLFFRGQFQRQDELGVNIGVIGAGCRNKIWRGDESRGRKNQSYQQEHEPRQRRTT